MEVVDPFIVLPTECNNSPSLLLWALFYEHFFVLNHAGMGLSSWWGWATTRASPCYGTNFAIGTSWLGWCWAWWVLGHLSLDPAPFGAFTKSLSHTNFLGILVINPMWGVELTTVLVPPPIISRCSSLQSCVCQSCGTFSTVGPLYLGEQFLLVRVHVPPTQPGYACVFHRVPRMIHCLLA